MKSLTSSKLFFSDIVYQFLQVLTLSRKSFCLLPVMGLISKAASCIPCNGGMKEEWFTQGVIFPAGVRVFPAGNLQNPQEILTKTLIIEQIL